MLNIVFICTGNTCRSPMAEALMKKKAHEKGLDITCSSKGIAAFCGDPASENAIEVMKEYGIDISSHRAKRLSVYDIEYADMLVCMSKEHALNLPTEKAKVCLLGDDIPDPYSQDIDAYRECAATINRYLDDIIETIEFVEKSAEKTVISPITQEDISAIARIEKECFSAPWSEKAIEDELSNESARFFVLKCSGTVLGYAGMHIVLDECYIANIAVNRNFRMRGYGEALLKHCIKCAKDEGCSFISLEVRVSNTPAISLYKKQGFSVMGERKNFYTNPTENALIMTKHFSEVD